MIRSLATTTLRECMRRAFPYVSALCVVLVAIGSRLFLAFSFGAGTAETANVVISAVFLAGFLVAAFQGTTLIRADIDRGTLGLILTKPVDLPVYVAGRFLGLAMASALVCTAVGALACGALLLLDPGAIGSALFAGSARAMLSVIVLDAAALATSAFAGAIAAPLVLFALLLATSVVGAVPLLPDFSLFGLEVSTPPPTGILVMYATIYASIFVVSALILLGLTPPRRSQG